MRQVDTGIEGIAGSNHVFAEINAVYIYIYRYIHGYKCIYIYTYIIIHIYIYTYIYPPTLLGVSDT